jgi:putative sterol carrier protein
LKETGVVKKGEAKSLGLKRDVTIILSDETFVDIADGKTTGQKAFLTGRLKTKGNMMLATKLSDVLNVCQLSFWLRHMLNCACYQSTKGKAKL